MSLDLSIYSALLDKSKPTKRTYLFLHSRNNGKSVLPVPHPHYNTHVGEDILLNNNNYFKIGNACIM